MDVVSVLVSVAFTHLVEQLLFNEPIDPIGDRARTLYARHCFQIVEGQCSPPVFVCAAQDRQQDHL